MIKVYTSYFYQIRNMRPGDLAFSTALGDPKWFHDFTNDKQYKFIDKRGVLNGLRLRWGYAGFARAFRVQPNGVKKGLCG